MLPLSLFARRIGCAADDVDGSRQMSSAPPIPLDGRRVLITGAARGIGAGTAQRLHERGARVALAGLEPELLARVAAECGEAPWLECDVTDRAQVERPWTGAVERLGGLDVVVANAGVAAQLPLIGGDPRTSSASIAVNLLGVYYTLRAAGPHLAHPRGYALPIASAGGGAALRRCSAPTAPPRPASRRSATRCASSCAHVGRARGGRLLRLHRHRHGQPRLPDARRRAGRQAAAAPVLAPMPLARALDAIERGVRAALPACDCAGLGAGGTATADAAAAAGRARFPAAASRRHSSWPARSTRRSTTAQPDPR